ncbi:MAG: L-ribulose-5-phosphate 4-epimerase AraD [Algisphaera sp.]
MKLKALRNEVCRANQRLVEEGLVTLTWGNVSGIDRESGLVAIKPSGVDYAALTPEQVVLVNLDGDVIEGDLRPSSDTPTHVLLYRHFSDIGGVTHTHSAKATAFAQARQAIDCLGTTHADHFYGSVPVTRPLSPQEVEQAYEASTGHVIVEAIEGHDPLAMPAVLVAGHAPFCWGLSANQSVDNAVALEAVAGMNLDTAMLQGGVRGGAAMVSLETYVLDKHHRRKHGADAYYGQK